MDWYDPNDPTNSLAENNGQFFETMDLIAPSQYAQPATYKRRISGDFFRQIGFIFRQGYVFDGIVSTTPWVFRFKKPDGTLLYALWTSETVTWPADGGRAVFTENVSQYTLNAMGRLLRFVDGGDQMSSEPFYGGTVSVDAKPIFIVVDNVSQSPLPIKLLSFTAEKQGSTAVLQWKVDGTKKFEVERSYDGAHFTTIAKLTNYSLVDFWPLQGFNFYRLKMIEDDGTFSYSPIARLQFSSVQLSATVLDMAGRKIKVVTVNNVSQFEEILKHDRSLPVGMYIIQYTDNKKLFFNNKIQRLP
jgi:hypothetical protein